MLHLVGTGPAGPILAELGSRPLRTKQLAERIDGVSPRSVYRVIDKLQALQLVERSTKPGPHSRGLLKLTEPAGRNLVQLLRCLAAESRAGQDDLSADSLCLVGELWELGFVEQLSRGPRSFLELLDSVDGLSYHQVRRRTNHLVEGGLLNESPPGRAGSGRHLELSDKSRRRMAVVAGLGRWRHRCFAAGAPGLEIEELATVLRAVLPLTRLPGHEGMRLDLIVAGPEDKYGNRETGIIHCAVGSDGSVSVAETPESAPDGSAAATINTWFATLLDGNRGRVRVRGNLNLVDACLTQLYDVLWNPAGS